MFKDFKRGVRRPPVPENTGVVLWSAAQGGALPDHLGVVTYFLLNPVTGLVKIGRTRDLKERLSIVRTMGGVEVEILGLLEGDHERAWHHRFHKNRVLGEWFTTFGPGNGLYHAIRELFKVRVTSRRERGE